MRPHGDLGSILTTYAASADREEYSFNANFTSQIASDNSISFSNLTTIPGGHSDGRELDIVIMIDGSDSFGETASTTEDSFKVCTFVIIRNVCPLIVSTHNESLKTIKQSLLLKIEHGGIVQ